MVSDNSSPAVEKLSGIGEGLKKYFHLLGVQTLKDLFYFLPKKFLDLSKTSDISMAKNSIGESVAIEATVKSLSVVRTKFKKMWIVQALLEDGTGAIEAIWFNQPYIHKNLIKGNSYIFYGQVTTSNQKLTLNNPEIYKEKGLYPIYRQTKKLSSKIISRIISKVLKKSLIPIDPIPRDVVNEYALPDLFKAITQVHQPKSQTEFNKAKYRFLFEELFLFSLTNQFIKKEFENEKSYLLKVDKRQIKGLIQKLPFALTKDQNNVLDEVTADFRSGLAMNRLLQGDVGSGKTVIAFISALIAIDNGYKVLFMAPTEILAIQHHETFMKLADQLGLQKFHPALITSKQKKAVKGANVYIGTHALINLKISDVALVIIDEQQRFGVEQRNFVTTKKDFLPHYLSLSATPIPRSLAHVIFSSCDLSVISQKPEGRIKIKTYLIPETKRADAYRFIDNLIKKRQQAFVVCPLINNSQQDNEKKSVQLEQKNLEISFPGRKIALLHGKMKLEQKNKTMSDFQNGKIDLLVSTSLIEVGIDIKNATVMIIEDADSFGLSQLHQFRGRIGRGTVESYCFAFTKKMDNPKTRQRLKAFIQNDDGFKLANLDLSQRGPGAFFDKDQSGFDGINPLWFENSKLLADATSAAKKVVDELDEYPYLKNIITSKVKIKHLE